MAGEPGVDSLFSHARKGDEQELGKLLTLYRNYLTILATTQLDARLRRRISPSDLVQEAMLGAYRDFPKFRGTTERELLAWLRQILTNHLVGAVRRFGADLRDVYINTVPSDAGDSLAVGDMPTEKRSVLYRARSQTPGTPVPPARFTLA